MANHNEDPGDNEILWFIFIIVIIILVAWAVN